MRAANVSALLVKTSGEYLGAKARAEIRMALYNAHRKLVLDFSVYIAI